jgi:hypothetical protein
MENQRKVLVDTNIKSMDMVRFKSQGYTPYVFNREDGDNFGLIEITKPLTSQQMNNGKPKQVFLLTPEEFEKVNKVVKNIAEMVVLYKKKINLLKDMVPSIMKEIIEGDNKQDEN